MKSLFDKISIFLRDRPALTHLTIALVATVPAIVLILSDLKLRDVLIILVYPLALSYGASLLTARTVGRAVSLLQFELAATKHEMIVLLGKARIVCHGTKYNVPNAHRFWNDLPSAAKSKFYLMSHSNKSWIRKTHDQSEMLADAMLRIVRNGGAVKVLSAPDDAIVKSTIRFVEVHIKPKVASLDPTSQSEMTRRLTKNFIYMTAPETNYSAVVSDDRLIIIPIPNSKDFRDDALVLELSAQTSPFEFHNYLSDIERVFSNELARVDIDWHAVADRSIRDTV